MVTATAEPDAEAHPGRSKPRFRGDVDGLRAIAIVLVVAYHAGLPSFGGGFVGVDVFFVISGFLISRNLLAEADADGRVSLAKFWARRVRRLVPALALVALVTLGASYLILPLYELQDVSRQGAAAALYVSNLVFASQATDYFAADISNSPFLQTWTLGVEEQFYLVWPVLFALVCWSQAHRLPRRLGDRRRTLIIAFAIAFVVSMALNLSLTESNQPRAFFSLPTRAWEFAVAGLLAAVPVPHVMRSVTVRTGAAIGGIALLVCSTLVIDDATRYPGLWALLPVGAAVLLITAGETWGGQVEQGPVSAALAARPMQWLGRVSYSWYLWHWPAIVLLMVAVDSDRVEYRAAAALASLPVAWLAYRFYETPIRFARPLAGSARTFAFGAAVTAVVLASAFAVWQSAEIDTPPTGPGNPFAPASLEAPAGSSLEERVNVAVTLYRQRSDSSCPVDALQTVDGDDYCVGGDQTSHRSILLLGDSHAGQWRLPLEQIAEEHNIRLLIRQHNGCPPYPVGVTDPVKQEDKTIICQRQEEGDLRVIDALDPEAVLIATWSGNRANLLDASGELADESEQARLWEEAVTSRLDEILDRDVKVGFIIDEPTLPFNASDCIAARGIEACEISRAEALATSGPLLDAERRVLADREDVPTIDLTDLVCTDEKCSLEIDGTLVYVDSHHFTDAFAAQQRPALEQLLLDLID